MRHRAEYDGDKVARGLEVAVDTLDLRALLVAFAARGIDEHLFRLAEIPHARRHRDVHIVVVRGDHQRYVLGIEGRHLDNHRILPNIDQAGDIQGIVIRPRNHT